MDRTELEDMLFAADEAAQAGDPQAAEDVQFLLAELDQLDAAEAPAPEPEETSALDTFSDFGRGIHQGVRNASQYGQDAVHRLFGNEDVLDTLNRKKQRQAEENAKYKERSPFAFGGGEVVGETLFTMPLAGGAGSLVRGGKAAADIGKLRYLTSLATEGAVAGGFLTEGDFEERAKGAATGAITDLTLGVAMDKAVSVGGRMLRNAASEDDIVRGVADKASDVTDQVRRAADDGGFTLDGATAINDFDSQDILTEIRNSPDTGPEYAQFKAAQEADVKTKATSFAEEFGDVDVNHIRTEGNYKSVQDALNGLKEADAKGVDDAYDAFRSAAEQAGYAPDRVTVKRVLGPLLDEFGDGSRATRGVAKDIETELRRYGVLGMRDEASKPLTFGNYEELIQDINGLWSEGLNDGSKRLISRVKGALDDSLDAAMVHDGLPVDAVAKGRAARAARRGYSKNWTQDDIVGKLTTTKNKVDDEFKLDYTKLPQKLDRESVKKIKARLALDPKGKDSWRSLQQAPLLDALAEATKDASQTTKAGNEVLFNDNAFARVLNKIPKEAQEELWGKDFVKQLDGAQAAWRGRTRRLDTAGSSSTSGTGDFNYGLKVGRFAGSGRVRNILMSLNAAFPHIKSGIRAGTRVENAQQVMKGEIPREMLQKWEADMLTDLEKNYRGSNAAKLADAVQTSMRVLMLTATNSETEK